MFGHPLPLPDLEREVGQGNVRAIARRRPSTIAEVLERGRDAMKAEEDAAEYAKDPYRYIRVRRPRHNLLQRLLHGKGTR
jgi:hypothetical protein